MELKKYKLGDIAEISTGFPFDGNKYTKVGTRVVRGENIGQGDLHWEERVDKRWNESTTALDSYWLYDGDIVMQMDGNVGKNIAQLHTSEPMLIAQRVACIRAKENCSQDYIYGILRTKAFADYIKRCATGTSIKHISLQQINDFKFEFHDTDAQSIIGKLITSLDNKIMLNRQINDNLEAMAKQLYDYWFVQFDFPNEKGKPYKSSGGVLVWNERLKREIPVDWQVDNLIDFAEIKNGATPSTADEANYGGDIVWITPKDLSDQQSKFVYQGERNITKQGFDSCSTSMLPTNSVLMSSRAPIGLVSIAKHEVCTNQGFKSFIPKNIDDSIYLYYYIKHHIKQIEQLGSGTTFKEVSRDDLCKFPILVVGAKEAYKKWIELQNGIADKQFVLTKEIAALTNQRDELLPLLMNGQATVNAD